MWFRRKSSKTALKKRTSNPITETRTLAAEMPRARDAWGKSQTFIEEVTRQIETGNELNLSEARRIHARVAVGEPNSA